MLALDGGGSLLKYPFADEVARLGRVFNYAFEWCAGMGDIGMHLLKNGLCKRLCLADINPEAIEVAADHARLEGFEDRVDLYVSDNMDDVPQNLRFDLVVANPPNYSNIQKEHPIGEVMYDDIRPNDRGWKIHRKFYKTIGAYLEPDAVMMISEVEPARTRVFIADPDQPYDVRDRVPMESFLEMTGAYGLDIVKVLPYHEMAGVGFFMLKIVKETH